MDQTGGKAFDSFKGTKGDVLWKSFLKGEQKRFAQAEGSGQKTGWHQP